MRGFPHEIKKRIKGIAHYVVVSDRDHDGIRILLAVSLKGTPLTS